MGIDTSKLRQALSRFATGITVVTTYEEQRQPLGVTVNSFSSISLEPALVLWCLSDQTRQLDSYLASKQFCINVLSQSQADVSTHFANPNLADQFSQIAYTFKNNQAPVIDHCLASLECQLVKLERIADHWLFIAEIKEHQFNDDKPLIFYASEYAQLV